MQKGKIGDKLRSLHWALRCRQDLNKIDGNLSSEKFKDTKSRAIFVGVWIVGRIVQKNLDRQIGIQFWKIPCMRLRSLNSVLPVFAKPLRAFEHSCNRVRLLLFKKIILAVLKGNVEMGSIKVGRVLRKQF